MSDIQLPLPVVTPRHEYGFCDYGNHRMKPSSGCSYADSNHGIPEIIRMCMACYAAHILNFYPNGRLAEFIRQNPANYIEEVEA